MNTTSLDTSPHTGESLPPTMKSGKHQIIAIFFLCLISLVIVFGTTLLSTRRHAAATPSAQPLTVPPPAPAVAYSSAKYGFLSGDELKSPYSDFSLNVKGLPHGRVLYDPHTGEPFLIP